MFIFENDGAYIAKKIVAQEELACIQNDLLQLVSFLNIENKFTDLNYMWNELRVKDRSLASSIYNGFKHLTSVQRLATSAKILKMLESRCLLEKPALVDINCRIDSFNEEKYLFDWHQDYWFSVCSPNSVVVWIPLLELEPSIGGLEIISNQKTGGRIFKTRKGQKGYNSYADAIDIDEDVSHYSSQKVESLGEGDALVFKFNVLHKSLPVKSALKSRFTIQLRFSDYADQEFIDSRYKPGAVSLGRVDYLGGKKS